MVYENLFYKKQKNNEDYEMTCSEYIAQFYK